MIRELSPEQVYELCCYHSAEPFGEVRRDMRMARLIQFYYDVRRGKRGRNLSLGELVLYDDMVADASDPASESALLEALGGRR